MTASCSICLYNWQDLNSDNKSSFSESDSYIYISANLDNASSRSLTHLARNYIFLNPAWNYFSTFFSRQRCYNNTVNILGITLESFWILWSPPKYFWGQNLWGGWGKEILGCFTGKSLYAQFHFTRQTTVEQISCQHHKLHGFNLTIGSRLWAFRHGVLWAYLTHSLTYLFCRLV